MRRQGALAAVVAASAGCLAALIALSMAGKISLLSVAHNIPPKMILEGPNGEADVTLTLNNNEVVNPACQLLGGQPLEYLDRQDIGCPAGQALNAFYITRCQGNDFRSVATCKSPSDSDVIGSEDKVYHTNCQVNRGQRQEYFDRHNVVCPGASVLSRWRLTGEGCGGNDMRVRFWCRDAEVTSIREVDSPCQQLRTMPGEFWDRQRPACAGDEVMKGFRLHSGGCGGNDMRFQVHCVKLLQPWWYFCGEQKAQLAAARKEAWATYSSLLEQSKSADGPAAQELKAQAALALKQYEVATEKVDAVDWQRKAVKSLRLYQSWSDSKGHAATALAHEYYNSYEKLTSLFQASLGAEGLPQLAMSSPAGADAARPGAPGARCLLAVRGGPLHKRQAEEVKAAKNALAATSSASRGRATPALAAAAAGGAAVMDPASGCKQGDKGCLDRFLANYDKLVAKNIAAAAA